MRDAPKPLHGTPCVNLAIASKASVLDGLTVPTDAMKIKVDFSTFDSEANAGIGDDPIPFMATTYVCEDDLQVISAYRLFLVHSSTCV